MAELKGKQLLVKVVLGLLALGVLSYGYLPEAYCPLENKTVKYIHMSDSRKTVTKVIPDDEIESWKISDDRCQSGMTMGQWIPINEELIGNCQSSLEECQAREFELCGDCPSCPVSTECPEPVVCPTDSNTCPAPSPCIQTCEGCGGGGGGGSCPTLTCPSCVNCDKVNTIAYIPDENCNIVQKWFCNGIGYEAVCYNDLTLETPFG